MIIDPPSKIICVGLNYRDHAKETNAPIPEVPLLFAKWPSALIGPNDSIVLPPGVQNVDYEGELGIVIGERAHHVPDAEALRIVAGYVAANDVSARSVQSKDGQWTRGKSYDTFCPVGPRLVPVDEVGDPSQLAIRTRLNGNIVQDSTTAELIFSIPRLLSFISECVTLLPGDLILTGTPGGVGMGRTPPLWLKDGDRVEVEIENVGVLCNDVIGNEEVTK